MQYTFAVTGAPRRIWTNDSWLDLWIYRVDACDGLPPSAKSKVISGVHRQLKQYRSLPCLWVQLDSLRIGILSPYVGRYMVIS